jgi:hypothetical protein
MKENNEKFSISIGIVGLFLHLILSLCFVYHNITFYELPVIKPTKYMFEKYAYLGTEKWEIYAEVVREIMCEVGKFDKSNKTFRDTLEYVSVIKDQSILKS